jgi:phosphoserine phosphatase
VRDDRVSVEQRRTARVALLDWDNSLHRGLTLRSWAHYVGERGMLPEAIVNAIEDRYTAYEKGEFPYRRLATETPELYARGLEGVREEELRAHARTYVEQDIRQLFPFSRVLLDSLVDREIETFVVSGSPIETLTVHQELLPISRLWGITVAVSDGLYTGELELNPAEQTAKDDVISNAVGAARVMLAIGDSEADIPMLEAAEAKIVVDNDELLSDDETTLHLSPDSTADGGVAELRSFIAQTLDR